ncbi:uncharacterized protein BCR38DRAFT_505848 [Pseudomassariella vexata]|uniref:Uncharacterized protein n=1 Tax=Pseudomassariella vexata TaxID=1141098 RepID=A0A1Y2DAE7_9PEZI|nr:uncharacterized protein BCR38DRAFT_505848 [Pseudomassariella vexata]ORY55635.1 hypothetical protein BCR38DRAFT_505848 [Pseudomassariella vexata]
MTSKLTLSSDPLADFGNNASHSKNQGQGQQSRELVFIENLRDLTPIDEPLFAFERKAQRSPKQYLKPTERPLSKKVADWQKEFFGLTEAKFEASPDGTKPEIEPVRPGAPVLVALFYPAKETRRPVQVYLGRIKNLAKMGEQTMIYVPPELSQTVKEMRSDKHWVVIDEYKTVWDFPNNAYQLDNFNHKQRQIFAQFDGYDVNTGKENQWKPNPQYNRAHLSAAFNAKTFISYDAVMRNPFGTDRWMYVDAGYWDEGGPVDAQGIVWGDVIKETLDDDKFDRSISMSRDTGIVMGEYMQSLEHGGIKDINHACWKDPKKAWMCHHFIGHCHVGNSLGMLNYSVRYMQTVDDLDANDHYSAREEFVTPWVAIRYPNSVFSIPWVRTPGLRIKWEYPMKLAYTTYGGKETVPPIVDPIETLMCNNYQPRRPNIPGGGLYKETWRQRAQITYKKRVFASGFRHSIKRGMAFLGMAPL